MNNKVGLVFYSDYFKCDCMVVSYVSDNNWWFKTLRDNRVMKAQTPLSHFIKSGKVKTSKFEELQSENSKLKQCIEKMYKAAVYKDTDEVKRVYMEYYNNKNSYDNKKSTNNSVVTITPFVDKFCGEERTIYSINNTSPESAMYSITTSAECPKCRKRHIFRFYDAKREQEHEDRFVETYDCMCPECNEQFDVGIITYKEGLQ